MKKLFKITLKPEALEETLPLITEHTVRCRSDRGNVISEAYQSLDDPCVVYLLSAFDTPENEKLHEGSEGDKAFIRKMQGKEAAPVEMLNWRQLV